MFLINLTKQKQKRFAYKWTWKKIKLVTMATQ